MRSLLLVCVAALQSSFAGDAPELPDGGTSLIPADWAAKAALVQKAGVGSMEQAAPEGAPFQGGVSVNVSEIADPGYRLSLQVPCSGGVGAKEVLFLRYYVRKLSPGEGWHGVSLQKSTAPYSKAFSFSVKLTGSEWKLIDFPVVSKESLNPGDLTINISLGGSIQDLEFGGFELVKYGADTPLDTLPVSTVPANRVNP